MSVRKGRLAACLCSQSKPGAAGLRGSLGPPLSRQISPCCSARRRSSWQLKSYPSWEGRRGLKTESRHNTEVNTFIVILTGHLLTIFSSNPAYLISLPPCVPEDICSARIRPLLQPSISFMHSLAHCCQGDVGQKGDGGCKCARLSRQWSRRVPAQTRPQRSQINQGARGRSRKLTQKALVNPQQQVN